MTDRYVKVLRESEEENKNGDPSQDRRF